MKNTKYISYTFNTESNQKMLLFWGFSPLALSPLYPFSKFAGCNMVKFCELTKFL